MANIVGAVCRVIALALTAIVAIVAAEGNGFRMVIGLKRYVGKVDIANWKKMEDVAHFKLDEMKAAYALTCAALIAIAVALALAFARKPMLETVFGVLAAAFSLVAGALTLRMGLCFFYPSQWHMNLAFCRVDGWIAGGAINIIVAVVMVADVAIMWVKLLRSSDGSGYQPFA